MAIVRANTSFSVGDPNGRRHFVREGTLVDDADGVVKGREHLFDPVESTVVSVLGPTASRATVEAATAAPGEKRAAKRPSKPAGS